MFPRPLQENFIEKVLRDPSGRLVRVTFHVYESNGRVKARIVNVSYFEEPRGSETLALCGCTVGGYVEFESRDSFGHVISPFVDSEFLYTLGSKPRAPTFAL